MMTTVLKRFGILLVPVLIVACNGSLNDPADESELQPPEITHFSPERQAIGRPITIYGTNFDPSPGNNAVTINKETATVSYSSGDSLTAIVPSGAADGVIAVTTAAGTAQSAETIIILGGTDPVLTAFSPETGSVGTTVTISGENFDLTSSNNEVHFNGTLAEIISVAETTLTVKAPDATSGNITVSNLSGTATSTRAFVIIDPDDETAPTITEFTPLRGAPGETVTITGTNFDSIEDNNNVKFNQLEAVVTAASTTSILVTVPNTTSGPITMITSTGVAKSKVSFEVIPADYTPVNGLQGGSVQSAALTLPGVVTTFAGGGIKGDSIDGTGTDARFDNPIGLASDGTYLYIADSGNRKIRRYEIATAEVETFAGSGDLGSDDGIGLFAKFMTPNGVVVVGENLYVTDSSAHKIRKIVIDTREVSTLAGSGSYATTDDTGTLAGFRSPYGITSNGTDLYVVDSGGNTVRKIVIATAAVTTLAGSYSSGSTDGTGTAASFYRPHGITIDGENLYIADTFNSRIRKLVISTGEVTTFAGVEEDSTTDATTDSTSDAPDSTAGFLYPERITTDGEYLYVSDAGNHKIKMIKIATATVSTLAGSGVAGYEDKPGQSATFSSPMGILVEGSDLYVTDSARTLRKIEIQTGNVTTVAGEAVNTSAINGIGTEAIFNQPFGITTDGVNLYMADANLRLVRKIKIDTAKVTTVAGSGFFGSVDATATSASFSYPFGITTDGVNLFVADTQNNKIRKIDPITGEVSTFAGSGEIGAEDGKGSAASFLQPSGITTDNEFLYVADTMNHKIRKIEISTGIVETVAGSGSPGADEGKGVDASFDSPEGITTDGIHLYVADSGNNKIRKINISSKTVTTLAGSGEFWWADGTGTAAGFRYPKSITSDGTNLYVADSYNRMIRKIEISAGEVTTLAGSGDIGKKDGTGTVASFGLPVGIVTDGTSLFVTDYLNHQIRKID